MSFNGGKAFAMNYTPKKHPVQDFKAIVKMTASQVHNGPPLTGPLKMVVSYFFPRPKSLTRKVNALDWKTTKPDWDNLGKSVSDALTGILWVDDAQLASVLVEKRICGDQDQPGTRVEVCLLT